MGTDISSRRGAVRAREGQGVQDREAAKTLIMGWQGIIQVVLALLLVMVQGRSLQQHGEHDNLGDVDIMKDKKGFDPSRWASGSDGHLYDFVKRFDASRWGGGSDGHLYDFAKRFDASRWGGGSDGHLYDFVKRDGEKRFDASRWGGGSDGHLYDFAKRAGEKRFDASRWGGGSDG